MNCFATWRTICLLGLALLAILACGDDEARVTEPTEDTTPPATVGDLTATTSAQGDSVLLFWTAPGDDDQDGAASAYEIRIASAPLTEESWFSASLLDSSTVPSPAGESESFTVARLASGTWHFALISADEIPNWSAVSNSVSAIVTNVEPPAAVADLMATTAAFGAVSLGWTAPGSDGQLGQATAYDLRYATETLTKDSWKEAAQVPDLPAPKGAGEAESFTIESLKPRTTYFFGLRTSDESGNWSGLSNVVESATDDTRQLTFDGGVEPAWSPDGTQLAFRKSVDGNSDIYVMPADGGDPVRLTFDPAFDSSPSWSPDGETIAFQTRRGEFNEIWLTDTASGSNPVRLAGLENDHYQHPAWSPDGSRIACIRGFFGQLYSSTDLVAVPVDGGSVEVVARGEGQPIGHPSWSPDGNRIAVISGRAVSWDVWTIPVGGGSWVRVTTSGLQFQNLSPSFSPDGSTIAYGSNPTGTWQIFAVPADGGQRTLVSSGTGDKGSPTWSPDGKMLAYSSDRTGRSEIWVQLLE